MTQQRLEQLNTEIGMINLMLHSTFGYGQTVNREAESNLYDQLQALKEERETLQEATEKTNKIGGTGILTDVVSIDRV